MAQITFEAQSYLKRYHQLVLPTITLVLVVVLTLAVLVPQILVLVDDFGALGKLQSEVGNLRQKATLLASLDNTELQLKVLKLTVALPLTKDLGYFVGAGRMVAQSSGVAFEGVEFLGDQDAPPPPTQNKGARLGEKAVAKKTSQKRAASSMRLTVRADMAGIQQLLTTAANSLPLNDVEELSFSRSPGESLLRGTLNLSFYFSPAPQSIGASDQPLPVLTSADESTYQTVAQFSEPETSLLPEVEVGQEIFIR